MKQLEHKVAVIYGAGGAIGSAVARAFAAAGATVFVTGRRAASVEAVAQASSRPAGSRRRRRSTPSTSPRWTATCGR